MHVQGIGYIFVSVLAYVFSSMQNINLPTEHLPYFFNNNPNLKDACTADDHCEYKGQLNITKCWGYEKKCPKEIRMLIPVCPGENRGWVKDKVSQIEHFWNQADFGYVKEKLEELTVFCKPKHKTDSSLECIRHARFCRAKNIYMDFTTSKLKESRERFREDVFDSGGIGGYCKFDKQKFDLEGNHKSALQSWYGELQHFSEIKHRPIDNGKCDVVIDQPTFLMKLDAERNELRRPISCHMASISTNPIIPLNKFDGKKVCFRDALFSLLPRMRYGHFYNMPLIPGCEQSSMYRAFSQHMVHRLNLTQYGPLREKIRVTLLVRSSKYRRILNQDEIVKALKNVAKYEVKVVDYNQKMPFLEQLEITHNSDIFMGMHGAGLTHLLFQPDWAAVFEIFNCDDENCYKDLARLRGIKYMTWENMNKLEQEDEGHHPTLGAHKKFTNYSFQVTEFLRLVRQAADYVRSHPSFMSAHQHLYPTQSAKTEL